LDKICIYKLFVFNHFRVVTNYSKALNNNLVFQVREVIKMMIWIWIIIAVVVIFLLWIWGMYNRLIVLKNRVENGWSQIDVQLKRRADLIPNLVNTVKGYVKHEKEVLENVTKARASLVKATDIQGKAKADNQLAGALKTLFAVAEAYPNLKANENFKLMQEELAGTENKIAYSRQFYNDTVMSFNQAIQVFPTNIFARNLGFKEREFFKTEGKEREVVKVDF